jgi:hypothetical protein
MQHVRCGTSTTQCHACTESLTKSYLSVLCRVPLSSPVRSTEGSFTRREAPCGFFSRPQQRPEYSHEKKSPTD